MTELLAALLGAIVGGVLSAWVSSRQTARVLRHETDLAAEERRVARKMEEERRISEAAAHLIAALADYWTVTLDSPDQMACFVRVPATADVHRDRRVRVAQLTNAGARNAHVLPAEVAQRWKDLVWLVRFAHSNQPDRSEEERRRDYADLRTYSEYVRRSLHALSGDGPMPEPFEPPDPRREGTRPWAVRPPSTSEEPDLTSWNLSTQLVGKVTFTSGEQRWYGPRGFEDLAAPATVSTLGDTDDSTAKPS